MTIYPNVTQRTETSGRSLGSPVTLSHPRSLHWWACTWVNRLNVPSEHAIDHCIHHKHGDSKKQVEVIPFHWGLAERVPLDTHTCHFIQSKVLGAQAKGCCGHQGLKKEECQ